MKSARSFLFGIVPVFSCLGVSHAFAQFTLATQDFETTPASPVWSFTSTGGGISPTTGVGGSRGFSIGNEIATLDFAPVNTAGLSDIELSFRLQARASGAGNVGPDVGDLVTVFVSTDGVAYSQEVRVTGFNNARWTYGDGTGVASAVYDGDNSLSGSIFSPVAGGTRTTDGYSTVSLSDLPAVSNLYVRIGLATDAGSEFWDIDNVTLSAIPEPSTYAAIFGAVTLGVVVLRRRFAKSGKQA